MHDAIAAVICLLTMSSLLHLEFKHYIEITALTLLNSSLAIWFMPDNRYMSCKWQGSNQQVTVWHHLLLFSMTRLLRT